MVEKKRITGELVLGELRKALNRVEMEHGVKVKSIDIGIDPLHCAVCEKPIQGQILNTYLEPMDETCVQICDEVYPIVKYPDELAKGKSELFEEAMRTKIAARCRGKAYALPVHSW